MSKITAAQDKKIRKAVKDLNDVLAEIQKTVPLANWYLEDTANLNLIDGESHDESCRSRRNSRQHAVIETYTLNDASGGAW